MSSIQGFRSWDTERTRADVQGITEARSLLGSVSSQNWRCPKADSHYSNTVVGAVRLGMMRSWES